MRPRHSAVDTRTGLGSTIDALSPRRREVLALIARGLTNDDIAATLKISALTVRTHLTAIFSQLEVTNRTEAATKYLAWKSQPAQVARVMARPAIAVLPFEAADETRRAQTLAAGLTHDISALFARYCWFPVIAPSSTAALRPEERDVAGARRLGARYVVGATLRNVGAGMRLSARVEDAETGYCLWTERLDFEPRELFDVEDAVCQAVVAHAYPVLVAHARATHMQARRCEELDAWWLAHEGMLAWEQRERAPNAEARANLEAAIAREPEFVLAHYGLGLVSYDALLHQWGETAEQRRRLVASAERCIELAPHAAEGHYLLGRYFQTLGDHARAVDILEQAIGRNPSFAAAYALLAQALHLTGRIPEARLRMEHAMRLAPRPFVAGLATLHFSAGDYRTALDAAERAVAMKPGYLFARLLAAAAAHLVGDADRATEHLEAAYELHPDFEVGHFLQTFGANVQAVTRLAQALHELSDGKRPGTKVRRARSRPTSGGPIARLAPATPPPQCPRRPSRS